MVTCTKWVCLWIFTEFELVTKRMRRYEGNMKIIYLFHLQGSAQMYEKQESYFCRAKCTKISKNMSPPAMPLNFFLFSYHILIDYIIPLHSSHFKKQVLSPPFKIRLPNLYLYTSYPSPWIASIKAMFSTILL